MKTRTCNRCSGTGFRNTGVLHLGVPGLCYGCNGSGTQGWFDAEFVTAEKQRFHDRHIAEVKGIISDCQAAIAMPTHRHRPNGVFERELSKRTEQLSAMVATVEPEKKGEWRPVSRQTVKA